MRITSMEGGGPLICPFCDFKDQNDYQMLLHVEIYHSEDGTSPFAVKDALEAERNVVQEVASHTEPPATVPYESDYVECPHKCGEQIPVAELQFHGDLHLAEEMAFEETSSDQGSISLVPSSTDLNLIEQEDDTSSIFSTKISNALRTTGSHSPSSRSYNESARTAQRRTPSLKELFFGLPPQKGQSQRTPGTKPRATRRLGTTELGPYANEKRMPSWLQGMLEEGAKVTIYNRIGPSGTLIRTESIANETPDLVDALARLSLLDRKVARAFYCAPEVRHIAKMKDEGGFCGYRNIQMLISYLRGAKAPGCHHFSDKLPTIIKLQDMIEQAWEQGHNAIGRTETGGIWLTRKYIGTSEAQALFQSLNIRCEVAAFFSSSESEAYLSLLQATFEYFDDQSDNTHKVVITDRPPIYFQHKGHSMTIVGVEVQRDGRANLIVFDPMFNPSSALKKLATKDRFRCEEPSTLLKAHRRGESYLSRYRTYEILKLLDSSDAS